MMCARKLMREQGRKEEKEGQSVQTEGEGPTSGRWPRTLRERCREWRRRFLFFSPTWVGRQAPRRAERERGGG